MERIAAVIIFLVSGFSAFSQVPDDSLSLVRVDSVLVQIDSVSVQIDSVSVQVDSTLLPPEGFEYKDSIVVLPLSRYTDSLSGRNIFHLMPGGVVVNQSEDVYAASRRQIQENFENTLEVEGYRIRIFLDNRQDAREASETAQKRFHMLFPEYETYRTYIYPNFKVTVGDFRTRTEAKMALVHIAKYFPSSFIVKERMKFPVVSQSETNPVDTIRVLVPIIEDRIVEKP